MMVRRTASDLREVIFRARLVFNWIPKMGSGGSEVALQTRGLDTPCTIMNGRPMGTLFGIDVMVVVKKQDAISRSVVPRKLCPT